jgi:nitroimidazol reductase NimA-like FMN-containing flavoprotein (pyridoxamine 5'-phosphate oxidase superfamily)
MEGGDMRRSKNEIKDRGRIIELLTGCDVGRLGTVTREGYPMIKPLNFIYRDGKIYFHSAKEGEKIDDIIRDSRVCFEVDVPVGFKKAVDHPCQADFYYRSVIVRGRATVVADDKERFLALNALMKKYQPEGGYGAYVEEKLAITAIVRIDIEEMTGKEKLSR